MTFSHVLLGAEGAPARITIRRIGFALETPAKLKSCEEREVLSISIQ